MTGGTRPTLVGVIADDVTGGSDVAVAFQRRGLRTALYFGHADAVPDDRFDVIVIALKTRTAPVIEAVEDSLAAVRALKSHGAERIFFKYCSTFDSTPAGNIGPVLDALMDELGTARVVQTPSSPEHGRTQYQGHLFVGGVLLSDSPLRDHPLTPMRDSRLVRLLAPQTRHPVSLVDHAVVQQGEHALRARLAETTAGHVLVDALDDDELAAIGRSIADEPLTAGGAGLAGGLARAIAKDKADGERWRSAGETLSPAIVLAGSCSARTLEQIDHHRAAGLPSFQLDADATRDPRLLADAALAWLDERELPDGALIASSLPPAALREVQARLGVTESAALFEEAMKHIARGARHRGYRSFIVAGGETSGAVAEALGARGGEVEDEAAPGVPWLRVTPNLRLLLKSGNFGAPSLLIDAAQTGMAAPDA